MYNFIVNLCVGIKVTTMLYNKSVAYAENFHGEVSFSGIWWSLVFSVRCL